MFLGGQFKDEVYFRMKCNMRREYTKPLFLLYSIFIYVLILIPVSFAISELHINSSLELLNVANNISIKNIGYFRPEISEFYIYVFALLALPVVIIACKLCLADINDIFYGKRAYNTVFIISILFILISALYSMDTEWGVSHYKYYLGKTVFNDKALILYLAVASIAMFFYTSIKKIRIFIDDKTTIKIFLDSVINAMTIFFLLSLFLINIFGVNAIDETTVSTFHLNAIYYSLVQLVNSTDVLYADKFSNTYGLYPHILEPIFHIIGGVNIWNFSIVMSTLVFISYYAVYRTMKGVISNRFYLNIGFLTILWFQYYASKPAEFDYYFQYAPLRTLFPSLLIFIAYKYIESSNKIYYFFGCVISAVSIFWNFDSGVVVLLSWLLFSIYTSMGLEDVSIKNKVVIALKKVLFLIFIVFIFIVFYYYYIVILLGAESFTYQKIFSSINLFSILGYLMEPIPIRHPWVVLMIVYIVAFSHSLLSINDRINFKRNSMVFLLSIMGFGLFTYYLGRSINLNLLTVSMPAIILITLYVDSLYFGRNRRFILLHEKFFFILITVFLSFSVINTTLSTL